MAEEKYEFGLVGLGVMGRNFILNVTDHGFSAMGLDRDPEKVQALKKEGVAQPVDATTSKDEFIARLASPRKIMMLVPAGGPVDAVIEDLLSSLDQGDLLIDGGNSFYTDTDRRFKYLEEKGIHFLGSGVSGGAKGARFGPSLMPGGSGEAYKLVQPIFEAAAAKVNDEPCVAYLGPRSAGNYVKMVHNGIEYALMQLISEIYVLMKEGLNMDNEQLHQVFHRWNQGKLQSFLIEITAEIFQMKDEFSQGHLVDMILDKAKQKGTGKWTSQNAMDLGIPVPTIDVAVTMREVSSFKDLRTELSKSYATAMDNSTVISVDDLENSLYFGFLMAYAQGMSLLSAASDEYDYQLDLSTIAKIWRGGCIIRASLLEDIRVAYANGDRLTGLLSDSAFQQKIMATQSAIRKVIIFAASHGFAVPGLAASLNYFDAFRSARLPLNLIQAQRDHFGSHTYERTDREGIFHTEWG